MNLDNMANEPFAFESFKDFFKSWGMYPHNEDTDDYNPEVIRQGINRACYNQMLDQAKNMYGDKFQKLVSDVCDAQDDSYFLESASWLRLQRLLDTYQGV